MGDVSDDVLDEYADDISTEEDRETIRAIAIEARRRRHDVTQYRRLIEHLLRVGEVPTSTTIHSLFMSGRLTAEQALDLLELRADYAARRRSFWRGIWQGFLRGLGIPWQR